MIAALSRKEAWNLRFLVIIGFSITANTLLQVDGAPLVASLAFSLLAFAATYALIRWLGPAFIRAGLKGKDLSKAVQKELPETMGAVAGCIYLLTLICFIPFPFYKDIVAATSGGGNRDVVLHATEVNTGRLLHRFPHSKLSGYLSALLTLHTTTLLGITDDILDLRWRHKVFIPAVASLPLLVVYYVDFGVTSVVIPRFLLPYIPNTSITNSDTGLIHLGAVYYLYMAALSIFAPNGINILAGVNGIEVGQSIVITLLLLLNSSLYLIPFPGNPILGSSPPPNVFPHPATDSHLFTWYLLLPFLAVSLALYSQNRYPARVFVGDTYCYLAGMVFAVVGILGHFSKTLLLLLTPQIFNFIYSSPQLFFPSWLIPCPRHRLPKYNARTNLLEPSTAEILPLSAVATETTTTTTKFSPSSASFQQPIKSKLRTFLLKTLSRLHLVRLTTTSGSTLSHSKSNSHSNSNGTITTIINTTTTNKPHNNNNTKNNTKPTSQHAHQQQQEEQEEEEEEKEVTIITSTTNLTLPNLWLVLFGPMREDTLTQQLLCLQAVLGLLGLLVRHTMALWIFEADNNNSNRV